MRLEDCKAISENADPQDVLKHLKFSKSLSEAVEPCKAKRVCKKCQKAGKMVCFHCLEPLVEEGVLPQINLPIGLYV